MNNKVILISIDGMRPDGFLACGNPWIQELMARSYHTLDGLTVYPPVTIPCHMSLFHSVPTERHGMTTNTYVPMVRPLPGLFEQIKAAGGSSAMFYGWEPLREVARPGSLTWAEYVNAYTAESSDTVLTDRALERIRSDKPDFVFLYMVETDEKGGHDSCWMGDTYLNIVSTAISNTRRVVEEFGDEYTIIVTADHGGHDRGHGLDIPEDMTIPMFYMGKQFTPGRFTGGSILDIAPTIAQILGVAVPREWEGKSILK